MSAVSESPSLSHISREGRTYRNGKTISEADGMSGHLLPYLPLSDAMTTRKNWLFLYEYRKQVDATGTSAWRKVQKRKISKFIRTRGLEWTFNELKP
ncbi:hypothetical protein AVEN_51448-1 [Araneus ventricosus]|uniref:Uncharacterized protein n=1 Tax=Araneus ventricosus TaxID=182803 RepID=A0A4Y2KF19_ARAVE|nr:hypothetical protein AVEN_51448-1 [Araneus ventricosus]